MSEIICIARSYGSGGRTIGKLLSQSMQLPCYDRELIYLASENSELNKELLARNDERVVKPSFHTTVPSEMNPYRSRDDIFACQSKIIRDVADKGNCVIIGRCASHILRSSPHKVLRVYIWARDGALKKLFLFSEFVLITLFSVGLQTPSKKPAPPL